MSTLPYDITASSTASAAEIQANLEALEAMIASIGASEMDHDNPISKYALKDRYVLQSLHLAALPISHSAVISTPAQFTCPTSATEIVRHYFTVGTGQRVTLHGIHIRPQKITSAAGPVYPIVEVFLDGVAVGGAVVLTTEGAKRTLAHANPTDNPMGVIADGSYISIKLSDTSGAGTATISGLDVTVDLKTELVR